jgi:hypothetical protein
MDDSKNATELAKGITVLDALLWVNSSWRNHVQASTISKCFAKCGFSSELSFNDDLPLAR